ncbi:hypothetical protein, partial [Burkholderia sp. SIMBA_019]
ITGDALGELARAYLLAQAVVNRLSRLYDAGALEAVMDGVVVDLSSEEAAEGSAAALEAKLRDDPLKPEVKVTTMYDPVR